MKKTLLVLAVFTLTLISLVGCTKTQATLDTQALIKAIGQVDADSEEAISAARNAYDALSDDERKKVNNADTLINAESEYADIVNVNTDIAAIIAAAEPGFSSEELKISDLLKRAEEIKTAYESMSEQRKAQVVGIENIDGAVEVLQSYVKNAETAAIQYVKAFYLCNEDQKPTVTAVYCIKQIRNDTDEYHFFAMTYLDENGDEQTVYSHARCTHEVTAEAIAERAESFFAAEPANDAADAKQNANVTLNLQAVLNAVGQ